MSDEFDLAHDKLPDQPVTIGGDKSAAAWHPNNGHEVPNADLIARLHMVNHHMEQNSLGIRLDVVDDAIATLADTVSRTRYVEDLRHAAETAIRIHSAQSERASGVERELVEARAERDALQRGVIAATERAEAAEAGRDALAHFRDQVRRWDEATRANPELGYILSTAPAVSLALHDAEVWEQGADAAAENIENGGGELVNPYRAFAIREEAGQ